MSDSEEEDDYATRAVADTSDASEVEEPYEEDVEEEEEEGEEEEEEDEEEEEENENENDGNDNEDDEDDEDDDEDEDGNNRDDNDNHEDVDDDDDEEEEEGEEEAAEVAVAVVDDEDDVDLLDTAVEADVVAVPVEEITEVAMADDDDDDSDDDPPILPPSSSKSSSRKSSSKKLKSTSKNKKKTSSNNKGKSSHGISGDRLIAAEAARDMLHTAVPRLPVAMNESYVVRNFGQLYIDQQPSSKNTYSTRTSLYPIGFSCDRFEFSPVHGRLLKLRCTIIDGQRTNRNYEGPIFRVMWGQGVDEAIDKVDYPYNPYANSAPISNKKNDVVAVPTSSDKNQQRRGTPTKGMRVKVRFHKDKYYYGIVEKVDSPKDDGKKKRKRHHEIQIRYDDGSLEKVEFPDPDVSLVMPGKLMKIR